MPEELDHITEPVERWPADVTRDDHETDPKQVDPWPPEVTRDDHITPSVADWRPLNGERGAML